MTLISQTEQAWLMLAADATDPVLFDHDGHQVRADVDRFTFTDGSMVGLHPVLHRGVPQLLLRCVRTDAHTWHLFSLAELVPEIVPELQRQPARDQRGFILYTLRGRFPGTAAFIAAVQACAKASGECDPAWRAAA